MEAILAQLPETTIYVHPFKLVCVALLVAVWALFAQWVDKDAVAVNTYRDIWNLVTIGCGIVALLCLFLLPVFWAGLGAFAVIQIALSAIYVTHRNGLVDEDSKVCTPAHIKRLITEGFSGKKKQDKKDVRERVRLVAADRKRVAVPEEEVEREQFRLTQELLFDVLWRRASVVDVVPAGQASKISYLIDGIAAEREPVPRPEGDSILMYLKRLAGLSVEERRKPQSGKLGAQVGDHKFDLVIHTSGSTAGERLQIRVIGSEKNLKVDGIGFTDKQLEQVRAFMSSDRGMMVVSAPPGHGLTTTLYSFARSHDAFLQNIQTMEYNRELEIENITHRVHDPAGQKSFTEDLQRLVRSDPDVIVLPEIRDKAAAAVAVQAANHKQRVYVGIPAADVWDAFRRWLALADDAAKVAASLKMVTHQRLVRKLCVACKTPYKPEAAQLRKLNLPADKVLYRPPEPQYDKHGNPILCQACQGSGYVGRTGVFHTVVVDEGLAKVIAGGGSISDIQAYCVKQGGAGLQQQALQKVFDGITSIEEVVRVTRSAAPGPGGGKAPAKPVGAAGAAPAKPAAGGSPTAQSTR